MSHGVSHFFFPRTIYVHSATHVPNHVPCIWLLSSKLGTMEFGMEMVHHVAYKRDLFCVCVDTKIMKLVVSLFTD